MRILALGVLCKPRSSFIVNDNARILLHPPGVIKGDESEPKTPSTLGSELEQLNARAKCGLQGN